MLRVFSTAAGAIEIIIRTISRCCIFCVRPELGEPTNHIKSIPPFPPLCVAMQAFVKIRRSEVPKYLHTSDLYLSLDESDDEISVPSDCIKMDDHVNNLLDVKNILFTMRYWILTSFPNGLIMFLVNPLNTGIEEILDEFQDAFPRLVPMITSLHNEVLSDKCNIAAKFGCVDFLEFFCEKEGLPLSEQTLRIAAANGHVDCLAYCHNWLLKKDSSFVLDKFDLWEVAKAGHVECLTYLVEHGTRATRDACRVAALSGELDCLKYLMKEFEYKSDSDNLIHAALRGNQVHCLQYLLEQSCEMSLQSWKNAVKAVGKTVGKFINPLAVVEKNQPVTTVCLEYLLNHASLPAGEFTLVTMACQCSNVEVLRLLHQRGFQFQSELVNVAAQAGSLECLQFLHDSLHFDCWVPATMAAAAGAGQLQLVKLLNKIGCAWDESAPIAALRGRQPKTLRYLLKKRGFPTGVEFYEVESSLECHLIVYEVHLSRFEAKFLAIQQ